MQKEKEKTPRAKILPMMVMASGVVHVPACFSLYVSHKRRSACICWITLMCAWGFINRILCNRINRSFGGYWHISRGLFVFVIVLISSACQHGQTVPPLLGTCWTRYQKNVFWVSRIKSVTGQLENRGFGPLSCSDKRTDKVSSIHKQRHSNIYFLPSSKDVFNRF